MKPRRIHLHKNTQTIELQYEQAEFHLSAEFLRVHSPSAEVKGHQGQGGILPHGKKHVQIEKLEAAGNYALKIYFNDGHNSGLYTWDYLHHLASTMDLKWCAYLQQLHDEHKSRDPEISIITFNP